MATAAPGTSTMAAATTATLDNPDYINWIRAGLGLLKLKIILTPATERILKAFYAMILSSAPLSATPACTCTFADIKWGVKTPSMKTNCKICSHFVKDIRSKHTRSNPQIYKDNCEPCKWATDWFEVAKAYMGPGMKDKTLTETDCSNILLLWEQCYEFTPFIQDITLLKNVRDSRNTLMHSASLTLTDAQMKAAFQAMLNLLKDTKLFTDPDVDAANGVSALEKIRDQGLRVLPEHELAVWLDLVRSQSKSLMQLEKDNKPVAKFLQNHPGLLDKLAQEWPKLEGRVSNLEGEMVNVGGTVSKQEGQIVKVEGRVSKQEGDMMKVEGRVSKQEGEVAEVKGIVSKQVGDMVKVEGRVSKQEGEMEKVEGRVSKQEGEVAEVQGRVSKQEGEVAEVKGRVSKQEGEVAEVEEIISKQEAEVAEVKGRVSKQEAEVAEVKGRVSKQEGEVADVKGRVSKQEGEVAEVKGKVSKQEGEVAEVQGRVSKQEGEVAEVKGRLSKQEGEVAEVKGRVSEQEGEVAQVKGRVSKQEGKVAEVKGRVSKQEGEVAEVKGRVSKQEGEVAEVKGRVSKQEGEVVEVKGRVSKQEREVAEVEGRVSKQEGEVAEVKGRVSKQEGEVAEVKGRVSKQEGEVVEVKGKVSKQEGEVAVVKGRVSKQEGDVMAVTERVAKLEQVTEEQEVKKETVPQDSGEVLRKLRRDLADHYTEEYTTIHPLPLVDLPLQDVLIPVSLKRVTRIGGQEKEHRSIEAKHILTPTGDDDDARSPKRVLVEGEPGQGKSLLCQSLAHSWAKHVKSSTAAEATTQQSAASQSSPDSGPGSQSCIGTPTQPKKAVVVHTFAILIVFIVHKLTVGDLSDNLLLLLLTEKWKSRKDAVRKCLGENCEKVLLILDGYDESASPHPEILTMILSGTWMKGCTIITTSRPGFCKSVFDVSYRLEGFDSEKRESYVKKYMYTTYKKANHPRQQLLLDRLQSTGTVSNLCENPLFLVLVCIIGVQEQNALPDRRTELYQQFGDFINNNAVERNKIQPDEIPYLKGVLQRVAFTLLKDNLPEITLATIVQCTSAGQAAPGPSAAKHDSSLMESTRPDDVMTRLCHGGFVAQGQHLQGLKSVTTGHFTHQSFVEYFAAKHVISASEEQQTTLIDELIKEKDIFHNVFVFMIGLATNSKLFVKLMTRWWGAMAAEQMPNFNPSELLVDMVEMGKLTQNKHTLHHAPLEWLAETSDTCSAAHVLSTLTHQLKAICLTYDCTEVCVSGMKALCGGCISKRQPTPRPLYLGLYNCSQFKACNLLGLLEQVALVRGVIDPVLLELGPCHSQVWTEDECTVLSTRLARIMRISIQVRGWRALDALSRGLTADAQLQELRVYCVPHDDDGGGNHHSLSKFQTNIERLKNIKYIWLDNQKDSPVSSKVSTEAARALREWGEKHDVDVHVDHCVIS